MSRIVGSLVIVLIGGFMVFRAFFGSVRVRNRRRAEKAELDAANDQPFFKDGTKVRLWPDGSEVFLPPLDPQRVYELTVYGMFRNWRSSARFYKGWAYGEKEPVQADALYKTDGNGNFVEPHDWLELNGKPVCPTYYYSPSLQEDRQAHRYSFLMDGTRTKISARLSIPGGYWFMGGEGALTVTVRPLPQGTPLPLDEIARQEKILKEFTAAEEKAKLDKKAAEKRTALENKLAALRCRAHREDYFHDADFQQKYARHHLQEILSKLKQEWAKEYDDFMQDAELKRVAEKQAPQVLAWLEARVTIVRLAERMRVVPAPAPQIQRKKRTAEEVRALKLRRAEVKADDQIALAKLKGKKAAMVRTELDTLGLDSQERETLETEATERILELGDEEEKSGTTL